MDSVFLQRRQSLRERIIAVTPDLFEPLALDLFQYQSLYNPLYRDYLHHLRVRPEQITELHRVPFMPISFFKQHRVQTGNLPADLTFASSGTTSQEQTSRHEVADPALYDVVSRRIFEEAYGPLKNFHILALLPSYLERNNSSLVYMVQRFMQHTGGSEQSGFYLNNVAELTDKLRYLTEHDVNRQILLIGVTFGLLDWAETAGDLSFLGDNERLIVMETGGMKGRRKELLREEVHELLTQQLAVLTIHSEYGMTELLSQAYSPGNGIFHPSPTLRVFLRDINDPFDIFLPGEMRTSERRTGGINVVDLANLDSCAFIETQDMGQYETTVPGAFRVIGRFDNSDIRGCNLLVLS